jgi:hypothetical protein
LEHDSPPWLAALAAIGLDGNSHGCNANTIGSHGIFVMAATWESFILRIH